MKIWISNIDRVTIEDDLEQLFEEFGEIASVKLAEFPDPGLDTFSAIIEMPYESEALEAINELNGERFLGQYLKVKAADDNAQLPEDLILSDTETEDEFIQEIEVEFGEDELEIKEKFSNKKNPPRREL